MTNQVVTQTSIPTNAVPVPPAPGDAAPTPYQQLLYSEAYDQVLPASLELNPDELIQVNVDVPSAVTRATAVLPQILAMRDQVVKELPGFDITHIDQLPARTFAVAGAHAKFISASSPPEALLALNEKAIALRDILYTDALALSSRGFISGDRIASFKANTGYKNIAFDLLGLASLLRDNWDKISSKTALQQSELSDAESLGKQLMDAVAAREQAPGLVAAVQTQRARNFTLFSRSYDQVRRALTYLRWDTEDVDDLIPSLYAGRGGRGNSQPDPEPTVPPTPPAPIPPVSSTPVTASSAETPAAQPAHAPAATGVGLPNSNPFATRQKS